MFIIVLIKQVPLSSEIALDPNTGTLMRETGASRMNPYDLFALETALQLKDQHGATVRVLSMGPPQAETVIREAFAMGADEGYLLTDRAFAGADVLATSYALSQGIKATGDFDLIICGKQTTDGDTAQVGPECSEFLGIPCIGAVQKVNNSLDNQSIIVAADTGYTVNTCSVILPALISVDKDVNQPRLPSFVRMRETAGKSINRLSLADLSDKNRTHYGLDGSPTQVVRIFPPEHNGKLEIWRDGDLADRLFQMLKNGKFLQDMLS